MKQVKNQKAVAKTNISKNENIEVKETVKKKEAVNHPSHYNFGTIEVIDAVEDWGLSFHLGNVVKYVARAEHKGNKLEDLKKAQWYLNRYIEMIEANSNEK